MREKKKWVLVVAVGGRRREEKGGEMLMGRLGRKGYDLSPQ